MLCDSRFAVFEKASGLGTGRCNGKWNTREDVLRCRRYSGPVEELLERWDCERGAVRLSEMSLVAELEVKMDVGGIGDRCPLCGCGGFFESGYVWRVG